MVIRDDQSKEVIEDGTEVPLDLGKIVIKAGSSISLDLIDWEKAGLRIGVSVEGLGDGNFNDRPYSDRETAMREYLHVLTQVQNGNYILELHENDELKLLLTDS